MAEYLLDTMLSSPGLPAAAVAALLAYTTQHEVGMYSASIHGSPTMLVQTVYVDRANDSGSGEAWVL